MGWTLRLPTDTGDLPREDRFRRVGSGILSA
jgi:hypothetical protein